MARGVASRSARLRVRTASVVVVVCLIAVSVSTQYAAASTAGPGREETGIAWTRCKGLGKQFECARVPVPLDWDRPNGEHIELSVIRHLASRPRQRMGSMFVNPGGPGQSGVELVRDGGANFDAWGGGRFDVVGWDPRGTNDSSPVECFTSNAAEARFWEGVSIPTTPAEAVAYQRKTVELARRCGEVSGELLSHISTADTARDLEALRKLVGDRTLTYVGLSYGSMIGQTYANLFPGRVRAMMLDGIVDAVDFTTNSEARTVNDVSSADEVFEQFLALCQSAAPGRCALAGHGETVAQRVAGLFARARRAPIPAPHADPPGELSYGDLLVSTFTPLRLPLTWPQFAADLDAAANGDATALETAARAMQTPEALSAATTSAAISCGDGPARLPSSAWPRAIARFTDSGKLWGQVLGWWLWAPCASHWPARSTDRYTGPWNAKTKTPILLISARYDAGTPYRNAQVAERRLGNAVLLTLNGYGHPSYQVPSTCIDQARMRYLVDLVTPPQGTVCQPDQRPFS
jgi:pimeloyl-ACP methyl ester carboxylesterase